MRVAVTLERCLQPSRRVGVRLLGLGILGVWFRVSGSQGLRFMVYGLCVMVYGLWPGRLNAETICSDAGAVRDARDPLGVERREPPARERERDLRLNPGLERCLVAYRATLPPAKVAAPPPEVTLIISG